MIEVALVAKGLKLYDEGFPHWAGIYVRYP
jgi:hypothetical protein